VQVWTALRIVREQGLPKLVNIVFMGMGEPLNNFENVRTAVNMLVHPEAFAMSRRHIIVSTVGPSPDLIAKMAELPCKLAWSVHAVEDKLRKLLVPTTRHSMVELRDAFMSALANKSHRTNNLLLELALMADLNDRPEHAQQLLEFLRPFEHRNFLVNLIPYNENGLSVAGDLLRSAAMPDVYAFQRMLWDQGVLCTVRATRGDEKRAACGQLATEVTRVKKRHREEPQARKLSLSQ